MGKKLLKNAAGIMKGREFRKCYKLNEGMEPTFLIYQITKACNSKCCMCSIWKESVENELTLEELGTLLSGPFLKDIRFINLTGGEPFLRTDLVDVVSLFRKEMPKLELIAIPTNGFATKLIIEKTKALLEAMDGKMLLAVTVSIDGLEAYHEKQRGIKGGFKKAMATLEALLELAKENEKFETGVEVVISKGNAKDLEDIYEFLKKYTTHINFTPVIMAPSGYYGEQDKTLGLEGKDVERMGAFFKKIKKEVPAYSYYFDKVMEIYNGKKRSYPCLGGYKTLYLDARGEVYPCLIAFKGHRLGNVRDRYIDDKWYGEPGTEVRKALKDFPFCNMCTNNCDILNNLKEETINFASYMMGHPTIFWALMKQIRQGKMDKYV